MKRGTYMLKPERIKLGKLVKTYLYLRGGTKDETAFYQYKIKTKAGELLVSTNDDTGAVFCRFSDPTAAKNTLNGYGALQRLNPYSGKWNFHWSRMDAEEAFQQFKYELDRVL
jgi:hypothetical protein